MHVLWFLVSCGCLETCCVFGITYDVLVAGYSRDCASVGCWRRTRDELVALERQHRPTGS